MKKSFKILICTYFAIMLTLLLIVTLPNNREENIIRNLQTRGYRFVLPRDYFNGDNQGKIALLIHDMDFKEGGLNAFVQIETRLGVKSAIYPRIQFLTTGNCGEYDTFAQLGYAQQAGWEIGYQQECLSQTDGNMTAATEQFLTNLAIARSYGWNITTTDYHGDNTHPDILNLNLYNETLWRSLGLHEVYKLANYSYYTDTNNVLQTPSEPLKDLIIIQLHTDWQH